MLVFVHFRLPDQIFSFEFSMCQCLLLETGQLNVAVSQRKLVFMLLKHFTFHSINENIEFQFYTCKKNQQRPTVTLCQQSGIATHSFQLSSLRGKKVRTSLQVKDKDLVPEEVRPERVLEMPQAALKFKSKKFVLAKWQVSIKVSIEVSLWRGD